MYKAIIIGCGKIAGYYDRRMSGPVASHAAAYHRSKLIRVVDYIDSVKLKAKVLSHKYGCSSYGTDYLRSMSVNQPDVVSICTPDTTHYRIVKDILEQGCVPRVIFLEKPCCENLHQLKELTALSRRKKVAIVVNHTRRFDERYLRLKRLIREGRFGAFVRGDIFYYGGWKHIGIHAVDLLVFLFGTAFRPAHASSACIAMRSRRSKTTVWFHHFDDRYYQIFDLDFKFEKARIQIQNFELRFIVERKVRNTSGEAVLATSSLKLDAQAHFPLENAVRRIHAYLTSGNEASIRDVSLPNAGDSMKLLWSVQR